MFWQVNQGLYRRGFSSGFQQNFEPKEWVNGLGPRAGQRWPTFPKHVLFVTSPPKPLHRSRKLFVFDSDYKTCWIRRGFEQLSSSIARRVIRLQSSTRKVAHAGLKGKSFRIDYAPALSFKRKIQIMLLFFSKSKWGVHPSPSYLLKWDGSREWYFI